MSSGGNASSLPLVGGLPEPTIKELSKPGRRAFNYPELDVPEEKIEHELGLKVKISWSSKTEKGFIKMSVSSLEQFDMLLKKIGVQTR